MKYIYYIYNMKTIIIIFVLYLIIGNLIVRALYESHDTYTEFGFVLYVFLPITNWF